MQPYLLNGVQFQEKKSSKISIKKFGAWNLILLPVHLTADAWERSWLCDTKYGSVPESPLVQFFSCQLEHRPGAKSPVT